MSGAKCTPSISEENILTADRIPRRLFGTLKHFRSLKREWTWNQKEAAL